MCFSIRNERIHFFIWSKRPFWWFTPWELASFTYLFFPCSPTILLITGSLIGRESPNLGFCYWGDPLLFCEKSFLLFCFSVSLSPLDFSPNPLLRWPSQKPWTALGEVFLFFLGPRPFFWLSFLRKNVFLYLDNPVAKREIHFFGKNVFLYLDNPFANREIQKKTYIFR